MSVNDDLPFLAAKRCASSNARRRGDVPMLGSLPRLANDRQGFGRARVSQRGKGDRLVRYPSDGRRTARSAAWSNLRPRKGFSIGMETRSICLPRQFCSPIRSARPTRRIASDDGIYGFQFHLEVTPAMIVDWSIEEENCGDVRELSAPLDPWLNYARCREIASPVFGKWCDMLGARG